MHSAVVPGQFSIAVASAVAKGHYDTGLLRYETFQTLAKKSANANEVEWFQQVIETGVSAVTNLALSLELSLKILRFQHTGRYPGGHDVSKLGLKLPEDTLTSLREQYLKLRTDRMRPANAS